MPTAPSVPRRSPIQVLTILFRLSVFPDTLLPLLGCLTARYFRLFNRTFLSSGALPQAVHRGGRLFNLLQLTSAMMTSHHYCCFKPACFKAPIIEFFTLADAAVVDVLLICYFHENYQLPISSRKLSESCHLLESLDESHI